MSCHTVYPPSLFGVVSIINDIGIINHLFIVSAQTVGKDPWVGMVSGMQMGLAELLLPFIRCQLSVVVNLSFSYNTLFLSSLDFMAAQYTPSGV